LAKELPRAALWRDYTVERDTVKSARQDAMASQQSRERSRRAQIRQTFDAARDAARNNMSLRPSGRRTHVSIARMTKADAEQSLRAQIQIERDALKAKYGRRHGASFGEFLQTRAQAGDAQALVELRRMRPTTPAQPKPEENWILPGGVSHDRIRQGPAAAHDTDSSESGYANQIIYHAPQLTYEVHPDGDVTYRHDGRSVVRDHGSAVRVLKTDRAAVEAALRLAQAKFGPVLKLQGPVKLQREAARIAAEAGLYVEFSDHSLNNIMQGRRVELIADRTATIETRSRARSDSADNPSPQLPVSAPNLTSDVGSASENILRSPRPIKPTI
jgi:hypothetical protein